MMYVRPPLPADLVQHTRGSLLLENSKIRVNNNWGWPNQIGVNYDSVSFGQLSGYIVFCILYFTYKRGFAPDIGTVQNTM